MKNVLELLESTCNNTGEKIFVADTDNSLTYNQIMDYAKSAASFLISEGFYNKPILVYMHQSCYSIVGMFAALYSGNYYIVIDDKMPTERINSIINVVNPAYIFCDDKTVLNVSELSVSGDILTNYINFPMSTDGLNKIRDKQIDTDPAYILFTSGSTGVPKGTVINHRNILSYSSWLVDEFQIDTTTVIGNQTPFYFSMSVSDLYGALRGGATIHIIPKMYFSFPVKLIEFMNERKINYIYWVPSAYGMVVNTKAFSVLLPEYLKTALFAGEVMPAKYLNYWKGYLSDVLYANLFGPTETTDICCFYRVNRDIKNDESIPIGVPCNNCDCIVINEDDNLVKEDEIGELYVRGSFVANGYFCDKEKSAEAFVQNPLNTAFPEAVYRTGDLVRHNSFGELEYVSRKDSQIKRMGYRIEIGEIEAAAGCIDGIKACCVVYYKDIDCLAFVYQGKKMSAQDIADILSQKIPVYMMPNSYIRVSEMLYNGNGKIDRKWLTNNFEKIKGGMLK